MFWVSVAHAMGAAPQGGGEVGANPLVSLMPLILMFLIFYFLLIRPQQKKAKQHKELLSNLKRGDSIITGGGIYGRISAVDGNVLTIDLGNNVEIRINRNFVSGLSEQQPREPVKKGKDKDKDNSEEKAEESS